MYIKIVRFIDFNFFVRGLKNRPALIVIKINTNVFTHRHLLNLEKHYLDIYIFTLIQIVHSVNIYSLA